ncbi:MAG TPA: hypothetical protein VLB84_05520 [Bacteroidia bacterium]|nr:hypothetical protein [Bacteroidia bacterium]
MNAELIHELNENLKKLLGSEARPKPKKKSKEERMDEYSKRMQLIFAQKNLKSKL